MTTPLRTKEERREITEQIRNKVKDYGIDNPEDFAPIRELFEVLKKYEENELSTGFMGRIKFPEIDRFIVYQLSMRAGTTSFVRMIPMTPQGGGATMRKGFRQTRKPTKAQLAKASQKETRSNVPR